MQTTFQIGPHVGRVCYVTGEGPWSATVECPGEKIALRFESRSALRVGCWVKLEGRYRFDPGARKDGTPAERNISYYHEPHDGSDKSEWEFRQLTECAFNQVGSPQFVAAMHEAMLCLRRHQDSWERNLELCRLQETADALRVVLGLLDAELEERRPLPVAVIDSAELISAL